MPPFGNAPQRNEDDTTAWTAFCQSDDFRRLCVPTPQSVVADRLPPRPEPVASGDSKYLSRFGKECGGTHRFRWAMVGVVVFCIIIGVTGVATVGMSNVTGSWLVLGFTVRTGFFLSLLVCLVFFKFRYVLFGLLTMNILLWSLGALL